MPKNPFQNHDAAGKKINIASNKYCSRVQTPTTDRFPRFSYIPGLPKVRGQNIRVYLRLCWIRSKKKYKKKWYKIKAKLIQHFGALFTKRGFFLTKDGLESFIQWFFSKKLQKKKFSGISSQIPLKIMKRIFQLSMLLERVDVIQNKKKILNGNV